MNYKVLSYTLFFIAVVLTGVYSISQLKESPQSVEKGKLKEFKIVSSIQAQAQKVTPKLKKSKDTNETVVLPIKKKDGKDEVSNTILTRFKDKNSSNKDKNSSKRFKSSKSKKDLNSTSTTKFKIKKRVSAEPAAINSNTILEFNVTSRPATLSQLLQELGAEVGDKVLIRIFKSTSLLEMWIEVEGEYKHLKSYPICAYSGDLGPKLKEGDKQAPEGFYEVTKKSLNPNSKFYLSMNIGYPNRYDKEHNRTGSFIMIHGDCVSVGCFAMGDDQIDEIYDLVESALNSGQKSVQVQIYPFRMTKKELQKHSKNRWYEFWLNLKEGYDLFEKSKKPLIVDVKDGNYTFK